jgi:hypothetical protein
LAIALESRERGLLVGQERLVVVVGSVSGHA